MIGFNTSKNLQSTMLLHKPMLGFKHTISKYNKKGNSYLIRFIRFISLVTCIYQDVVYLNTTVHTAFVRNNVGEGGILGTKLYI